MKVFITGVTGYLGGSLARHFYTKGARVTGLVRSAEQAPAMEAAGYGVVIGSLEDGRLLSTASTTADVTINAASSDNIVAIEALVEGLSGTGKTLIHSSGSSLIADDARGEPSSKVFDETTIITPVPEKRHRLVIDKAVRDGANHGIRSIVLCNSLIYGEGLGDKKDSIQIPLLVRKARQSGARYIGRGENVTSTVHISDVVKLYEAASTRGRAGAFYFVENGESSFGDMVRSINRLHGKPVDRSWTVEEASEELGNGKARFTFGSNTRMRGTAAKDDLDWAPAHGSALDYIELMYGI